MPYRALGGERFQLNAQNFHEIMMAIKAIAPYLSGESKIDKEIIGALWSICHHGRHAIRPDEVWRSNGLMTSQDASRLEKWIDIISYTTLSLLNGSDLNWEQLLKTDQSD